MKLLPTPRAIYGEHPGMTNGGHLTAVAIQSSHTLTCSAESAASLSPQPGPDTGPSASAKSTPGVSACSESTGQMSLFGEMCEGLTVPRLWMTPKPWDGQLGRTASTKGRPLEMSTHLQTQVLHSSPPAIRASHSHSPGSAWARRMTATYGRKLGDWWLSSDPLDACLRMLLGTSTWGSMTCYLTWRRSVTPAGRLLFRLVPSTRHTAGIGSGFWGTPTSRDWKDGSSVENVPENGLLGMAVVNDARMLPTPTAQSAKHGTPSPAQMARTNSIESTVLRELLPTPRVEGFDAGSHRGKPDSLHAHVKLWPTPRASENENRTTKPAPSHGNGHGKVLAGEVGQTNGLKLNSAWVSRMMGFPDDWLILDGEETP